MILTALCGHGHLDLAAYEAFLSGEMVDYDLPDEAIAEAMARSPGARLTRTAPRPWESLVSQGRIRVITDG